MLTNGKNDCINNENDLDGKDGNDQDTICNRLIHYATTATIVNNIFTTKYTLDIRPEKYNHVINSSKVHQNIFEAIKQMDKTAAIITHDNTHITNNNTFPTTTNTTHHFPTNDYIK